MAQLVLRLQVGDVVYLGARLQHESEEAWKRRTGWMLDRIVAPNEVMELRAPDGSTVKIYENRGMELVPNVIAFVGVTPSNEDSDFTVARVVFRAPKEIPILRAGAQHVRW